MTTWIQWLVGAIADTSPKVKTGLNWGVLASLVLALANSITPQMLSGLGPWEPFVWALIPVVAAQVAAWCKTDPAIVAGKAALAAQDAPAPQDAAK